MSGKEIMTESDSISEPHPRRSEALIAEFVELESQMPYIPMTYTSEDGWLVTVKKFALPVAHEQRRVFEVSELGEERMPEIIISAVSDIHEIPVENIKSDGRSRDIVEARHDAMYLICQMTAHSYPRVGREVGGFDHTTVMNARRKVEGRLEHDPSLEARHTLIRERLDMYRRDEVTPIGLTRLEERVAALVDGDLHEFGLRGLTGQQRVSLGIKSEVALDGDERMTGEAVWRRHGQHAQEALAAYRANLHT